MELVSFFILALILNQCSAQQQNKIPTSTCDFVKWGAFMGPFLEAEGASQSDRSNVTLSDNYERALNELNKWKSENPNRLTELCLLRNYLECNKENVCVCGTGRAPYSFEEGDGKNCLAKRGSICLMNSDCVEGLRCKDRYCGGAEAFIEEREKSGAVAALSNILSKFTIISSIVGSYLIGSRH